MIWVAATWAAALAAEVILAAADDLAAAYRDGQNSLMFRSRDISEQEVYHLLQAGQPYLSNLETETYQNGALRLTWNIPSKQEQDDGLAAARKLGAQADEELMQMQKTCASILGFVHNHPEQLNRVRRFREYYLPTTRKLLDTAQGLGETDTANAAEIRRDITGILHTLNQAYEKLYDTLLQDVSMDVSTEIDTLEAMLRQDGLTHDFEADFNTRS